MIARVAEILVGKDGREQVCSWGQVKSQGQKQRPEGPQVERGEEKSQGRKSQSTLKMLEEFVFSPGRVADGKTGSLGPCPGEQSCALKAACSQCVLARDIAFLWKPRLCSIAEGAKRSRSRLEESSKTIMTNS